MANLKDLIVQGPTRAIGRIYAPNGLEGVADISVRLGTATVGGTSTPIYLDGGLPKAITGFSAATINAGTLSADRLPTSGVTANSYGPSANASPDHGGTFSVPYVTVDNKGRITAASTKTITLPAQYSHPTYTAATSGLYKITVNTLGHVSATDAVTASDLPAHTHDYVPNTQAGVNAALNLLSTGSSVPSDDDYFISQYVNGGTTTTTYHRRPVSKLWDLFKTKISATNSDSGSVVIGVTQTNGAFTVSLGEPNVTVTNPISQTNYGILFAVNPNTTERNVLRKNNNFRFREILGTTSAEGTADIILGNNIAKETANNLTGTIILYGDGEYNVRIKPITGVTANRTIYIPNKNGTFALTSDIVTYSAGTGLSLSGTTFNHSNSITAVTTAVFKKFTYDASGHITGTTAVAASDLPSHTHSTYVLKEGDTMTGSLTLGTPNQAAIPTVGITVQDIRNATNGPDSGTQKGVNFYFTNAGTPSTGWWSIMHVRGWTSSYSAWELAGPSHNSDQRTIPLYFRSSYSGTAWGSWRKIYDTSNPPTAAEVGASPTGHTHSYLSSAGVSSTWVTGIDNAVIRMITTDDKYRPIVALRTESGGFWEMGNHTGDSLLFTFVSAENYSTTTNTATAQIGISSGNRIFIDGVNNRQTSLYENGLRFRTSSDEGWVMGMNVVKNSDNSALGSIGLYGGVDTLTYAYIGPSYTDYRLSVAFNNTNGDVTIRGDAPSLKFYDTSKSFYNLLRLNTLDANRTIDIPNRTGTIEVYKQGFMVDETSDFASYSWHKLASTTLVSTYLDRTIIFMVSKSRGQVPTNEGILTAHIRTEGNRNCGGTVQLKWLLAGSEIVPSNFVLLYKNIVDTRCDVEIWYKQPERYDGWVFKVLNAFTRVGDDLNSWTIYNTQGHGSATYTSGYTVVESGVLTHQGGQMTFSNVTVDQTQNIGIVRPLLIAASNANPSNTYQSSSSASAESRSTAVSYTGLANMTGGAYIKTRQWTSGNESGKTYTTVCAGSFETTDPDGRFIGLASKAYADEEGSRIIDHYGLKTDKLYEATTTTLSSLSNQQIIVRTLTNYDFIDIVVINDSSGITFQTVRVAAIAGTHMVTFTGGTSPGGQTLHDPILVGGAVQITDKSSESPPKFTVLLGLSNQYEIKTSVTQLSTAKVFKIYKIYGVRV